MNLGAFMDPEYPIFSTTLCYLERDDAYLMLHRIKKQDDLFILAWKDGFVNTFLQISAGVFPSRDPDKKAPSRPGKRAPNGAWKHMLFSYRSLKNQ